MLDALGNGLRTEPQRDALCAALAGRHALLVLDNCEQVAGDAAREVAFLLERLPLLHVLATSRRALGVDGEQVLPLPALTTPDEPDALALLAANPAVALFVDRARLARTDFHLTAANAAAVAGLVRWLDGMPLAIELAAARVRTLAPAQMLALMQGGAGSGLKLVARNGPRGGADGRHASMIDVVAWSWHLLGEGARTLLADMSLFPGGFTLEAARAVGGAALAQTAQHIDELVEHSMLRPADGERFAPYEVIREFAAARLDAERAAAARGAQRRWLLDWARALPATPPLAMVRAEMPNIVAVLAGCVSDADAAADAIDLLALLRRCFEDVDLPAAGLRHLESAIEACGDGARAGRGRSLIAGLLFNAGRADDALRHARLGLDGAATLTRGAGARAARDGQRHLARQPPGAASAGADRRGRALGAAAGAIDVQASLCALRAFILAASPRRGRCRAPAPACARVMAAQGQPARGQQRPVQPGGDRQQQRPAAAVR